MRRFLKQVLENGREEKKRCGIRVVYGWYTEDIRGYTQYIVSIAYTGYTGIYGDIRGYTGIYAIHSIAYIGYTGIYGDIRVVYGRYTGGIRVVYGTSSEIKFSYVCMFDPQKKQLLFFESSPP